ncbi:peptidylprolyl isomerase [Thermanaerothrix sp.]|jgi:peptidyl-prolyl cis-trans isomerase C|uniref:peptidylprolyl isomerase n=1 Tax=Thermanaerothrix sp. TaxID=2972675 RepID=UPI002ADDD7F5|nr:peptidylprolyl isomerase [Thermanaerothrix sp.]
MLRRLGYVLLIVLGLFSLNGCWGSLNQESATLVESSLPSATLTPIPSPTVTPEPLALQVNGLGITLREFEAERQRLRSAAEALGQTLDASTERERLVNEFIDQLLLAQAAYASGYQDDEAVLEAKISALKTTLGGDVAWQQWLTAHNYTEVDYRQALARALAAAWQRDRIIEAVPQTVEQVHVRQILTRDQATAEAYYRQLQAGADFDALAFQIDPVTGGDLGWFPRGYMTRSELEAAVFALEPGQYTPVIQTDLGFHILKLIARDPQRPLSVDARRFLQHQALQQWLDEQRRQADIKVLVP